MVRSRALVCWLLVVWLCASLFARDAVAQTVMAFGAGEVTLPAYFERYDTPDTALAAVSKPQENVRLFFDFHKLDDPVRKNLGEAFVREQSKTKGRTLRELAGKVAFFDPGKDSVVEGRQYTNLHWQIGFGNSVVVMTAVLAHDGREAPDVKQFLEGDIERIVSSLRRVQP